MLFIRASFMGFLISSRAQIPILAFLADFLGLPKNYKVIVGRRKEFDKYFTDNAYSWFNCIFIEWKIVKVLYDSLYGFLKIPAV